MLILYGGEQQSGSIAVGIAVMALGRAGSFVFEYLRPGKYRSADPHSLWSGAMGSNVIMGLLAAVVVFVGFFASALLGSVLPLAITFALVKTIVELATLSGEQDGSVVSLPSYGSVDREPVDTFPSRSAIAFLATLRRSASDTVLLSCMVGIMYPWYFLGVSLVFPVDVLATPFGSVSVTRALVRLPLVVFGLLALAAFWSKFRFDARREFRCYDACLDIYDRGFDTVQARIPYDEITTVEREDDRWSPDAVRIETEDDAWLARAVEDPERLQAAIQRQRTPVTA